jgi:homoserine dehydrogenase
VPLRLLIVGYGNVARSLLPLLASRRTWFEQTLHVTPYISGIGTRHQGFYVYSDGVPADILAQQSDPFVWFRTHGQRMENIEQFITIGASVSASVCIELTTLQPQNGEPARTHIRTALQSGMHVITANKGPVAYAQHELLALARQHHRQFRFESTVMDGFPLLNLKQFTLQAVGIRAFRALLNTTSSLVLSLIEQGRTMQEAIHDAQERGIAEADPSYDLDGWDAAMKTTILANTLLEGNIQPSMVTRESIRTLSLEDIREAARMGTPVRLISEAKYVQNSIVASVHPQKIQANDILLTARGTTSIITLETETMGTMSFVEHEPEVIQTAYGVMSDLIIIQQSQYPEDSTG